MSTETTEKDVTEKDAATPRRFVRPIYFTPKPKKPRPQQTEAELDAEFAIPAYVLEKQKAPSK